MQEKSLEERVKALEEVSHIHADPKDRVNPMPLVVTGNIDYNPEAAYQERVRLQKECAETHPIDPSDVEPAKKRGGLHGDPVFVVMH